MNVNQRREALGALGEKTVAKWFNYHGITVKFSTDKYDMVKDMVVDGETVEIKTLMPIFKYNAFCLPENQGFKCDSVDRLIFVKIPHKPGDPIELYESVKDNEDKRDFFKQNFVNQYCRFYRLTLLENIGIIHDTEVSTQMWDLSLSKFKGNDEYRTRVSASTEGVYGSADPQIARLSK